MYFLSIFFPTDVHTHPLTHTCQLNAVCRLVAIAELESSDLKSKAVSLGRVVAEKKLTLSLLIMQINKNNLLIQLQATPETHMRLTAFWLSASKKKKKKKECTALPNHILDLAELRKYKISLHQHPSYFKMIASLGLQLQFTQIKHTKKI